MNAKRRTVEGLVLCELSTLHIEVLKHAAEISPFVTERTLGPDMKIVEEYKDLKNSNNHDFVVEPAGPDSSRQNAVRSSSSNKKPSSSQNSLDILHYDILNKSMVFRETELNRKSIRKQIEDICKHAAKEERIDEIREELEKERQQKLKQQIERENEVIAEAKQQTRIQLCEDEREIAALRGHSQYAVQMITVQAIVQYQKRFRIRYEKVARLLMSLDKQTLTSVETQNAKLKSFVKTFDQLVEKIRNQEAGTYELKIAENLCNSIEELEENILVAKQQQGQLQLKQQQQVQEQEKQLELQNLQTAKVLHVEERVQNTETTVQLCKNNPPEQKDHVDNANPVPLTSIEDRSTTVEASTQFVSKERFIFYTEINKFYTEKVERVKPLQSDESMKKYRFACQKAINIPVNAISAVSQQHLQDKFEKLYSFVSGNPLKTVDGQITVNDHPLGRDYCILLMAKKFVSQGDTAISSNPQAAFPVATVIVSLWKLVPEFGKLFLAYIFKESPFLVPYFIPQKRGQSVEEYSKTLGYRVIDGKIENQDMYLKRQSGIARLYSAVMITSGRLSDGPQHPYGIENGWIWLSNFISLHPLPDICSTLMLEFIQNAGADMLASFGRQFRKLLLVIQQYYFPKLSSVDEGGPKARLEILLGKVLEEGKIPRPQGILPSNFW